MDELKRMEHLFRQAMDGQPWHGPSLAIVLQGVDARTAAARPIDGAHSIWEITLHLTGWTREV
ncbi:MAG TPA: DinB family protein, partial [Vicinamibacteria bacterium]